MTIAEELRLRRVIKNLTQRAVAREAGVCAEVLCYYERGLRVPRPEVADRILTAIEKLSKEVVIEK